MIRPIAVFVFALLAAAVIVTAAIFTGNGVLVLFGTPTAYLIDLVLPDSFLYWLVPEGGAAAAMLLFIISTWLQLAVLFVAGYYFWWYRFNSVVERAAP